MPPTLLRKLRLAAPLAAVAIAAAAPGAANAGALVADAPSCDSQTLLQPFLPWADVASYTLDPGGSFEPGSGSWALDGAGVVKGNEPFNVGGSGDSRSLSIPSGAGATSKSLCVGLGHPDIRFFAKGSNALATLKVEVLFEDGAGNAQSATIGAVAGSSDWSPTVPMPIVANLLPLLPNGMTPVAFRFTASGGSFQIDDLYVDPYRC